MLKVVEVEPVEAYRLRLRYADGAEGEVDFSDLAGKGVFSLWNDYRNFERVFIGEGGEIAWSEDVAICPDAAYMRLTGKSPSELFHPVQANVHA